MIDLEKNPAVCLPWSWFHLLTALAVSVSMSLRGIKDGESLVGYVPEIKSWNMECEYNGLRDFFLITFINPWLTREREREEKGGN